MPFQSMAGAGLLSSLIGGQQLGAPAPAPQLGQMGPQSLGSSDLGRRLAALSSRGNFQPLEQAVSAPVSEQIQGATQPISMGPPAPENDPLASGGLLGGINGFFSGLDNTLESPSKVLGLGLLSRIGPEAALAGLLAGGLLGRQ